MDAAARSPRLATLLFGALFIFLVAVLFHLPALFFMSASLVLAPVVSYWLAAAGLPKIRAERRLPSRLWPDERVEVELRLENRAWLPKCLLQVDENLPEGLEGDPDDPPGCVVPMLWGDLLVHRYPLTARHRGRYQLSAVTLTALDTFDLFKARCEVGTTGEVVVYPRRVPLKAHALHSPLLDGPLRRRRPVAAGIDFRATREYEPGDDLRRVHWPSTARRHKPIVMEFEEPATTDLFLVLDTSAEAAIGDGKDRPFETGITACASVIEHELMSGNAVGLYLDGAEPHHLPLTKERADLLSFYEALAVVEPDSRRPFAAAVEAARAMAAMAVVVLVTPACDELTLAAVQRLAREQAVAYAWLDPTGYAGAAPAQLDGFAAQLRLAGVTLFRLRRSHIADGLAQPI